MADRLDDLFTMQAELAEMFRSHRPEGFYAQEPITRCTTWTRALMHEVCELDDELNWKPWKNSQDLAQNSARRMDEMADILHFFLQLALDQGFTADDLFAAYGRKHAENRRRQEEDPLYRAPNAGGSS
jgi:dimeric dUTPase (all-alpha-NTP-PPase superfamily)